MKYLLILMVAMLAGCGSIAIPGYQVSVSAFSLGPVQVGTVSLDVNAHTDTFSPPSPASSPSPSK